MEEQWVLALAFWREYRTHNGPESSGRRTRFLARLVDFAEASGLRIRLVYYLPSHGKYHPIERCWGVLERHWNGALLRDAATALGWARTMMCLRAIHHHRKIPAPSSEGVLAKAWLRLTRSWALVLCGEQPSPSDRSTVEKRLIAAKVKAFFC